jgi:hypothetical protein
MDSTRQSKFNVVILYKEEDWVIPPLIASFRITGRLIERGVKDSITMIEVLRFLSDCMEVDSCTILWQGRPELLF